VKALTRQSRPIHTRIPNRPESLLVIIGVPKRDAYQPDANDLGRQRQQKKLHPYGGKCTAFWDRRDLVEVFGLAKRAYRKSVLRLHPDRNGDADQMVRLNLCWARLKRIAARRGFDLDELGACRH
jgi:hypothetical protein